MMQATAHRKFALAHHLRSHGNLRNPPMTRYSSSAGGVLSVVPGMASMAVWSPGHDLYGNSHLGSKAMERLTTRTDWSVFGPDRAPTRL